MAKSKPTKRAAKSKPATERAATTVKRKQPIRKQVNNVGNQIEEWGKRVDYLGTSIKKSLARTQANKTVKKAKPKSKK